MSDDDCEGNPIGDLAPPAQAMELAQTMDRLAKVDLLNHWSSESVVHAFGHCTYEVRLTALYTWAAMLNLQVRSTKTEWHNKMLLWDRLPCHQGMIEEAKSNGDDDVAEMGRIVNDAMQLMNFAGEDAQDSAVSMALVRCREHAGPEESYSWWTGMMIGVAHFASHVGTPVVEKIVSAYTTAHPQPMAHALRVIGGEL